MYDCFLEKIKKQEVEIYENFLIKTVSPIAIGARAALLIYPLSELSFIKSIEYLTQLCITYKIVGRMSNILPRDDYFDGVIISTAKLSAYTVSDNIITAQCGIPLPYLAKELEARSISALEELSGIPGTLGGALVSNAGAFGKEISEVVIDASVYDGKEVYTITKSDMRFSYRDSIFKKDKICIISSRLIATPMTREKIAQKMSEVKIARISSQPKGRTLGSVFKRYNGIPVSALIDNLGLKGFKIGGAEISKKHAGFIVVYDNATANDVRKLISFVKSRVREAYGFTPEEEIEYL